MIIGVPRPRVMGDLDPNQILSPSRDQLGQETDELLARTAQLGQDWFNSDGNNVSQNQLASWRAFVAAVKSWDAGPRFITHLLGTTWRDELVAYQQQFNDFRAQFLAAGVQPTIAPFTFNPGPPGIVDKLENKLGTAADKVLDPLKKGFTTLEYVGVGLGVTAIAFIFYLTYETGRTARAIGPRVLR